MRQSRRWWPLALVLLLSFSVFGFHLDDTRTGQSGQAAGETTVDVIISFSSMPRGDQLAYIQGLGGRVSRQYQHIPAVSATLPQSVVTTLRRYSNVVRIEEDTKVQALEQTVPWGIAKVNAPAVHAFATGAGAKVAVIDTGIDTSHQDLVVAGGVSFVSGVGSYTDDNGHGSHVAGTIAARNNTTGVLGMAPGAQLYSVKVLNNVGSGSWSSVISGIDWAITNCMQVVNMSLGSTFAAPSAVQSIINAAYNAPEQSAPGTSPSYSCPGRKGIVLVAAAGNSGNSSGTGSNVNYPAKYPQVIAVAAIDEGSARAGFSSTGSEVGLSAPGVNILSTTPNNTYSVFNGTSMASPHVAGLAALLIASGTVKDENGDAKINNQDVRLRMEKTATDLGNPGRDSMYGYGLINAAAAVIAPPSPTNHPPVAKAGGPYSGTVGAALTVNGSGSSDPDGDTLTYAWTFGDGGTSTGVSPSHIYAAAGAFTVNLTVNDGKGGSNSNTATATITALNTPPVANAGPDKSVTLGSPVTLDGTGSVDSDGSIASYGWNFGDGASATGATVSHTYGAAGSYTATLTVTDNNGATAQDTAVVQVSPAPSTMHIGDVTASLQTQFWGWKTWAVATVTVVNGSGAPVSGVTVTAQWSGATSGGVSGTTNSSGVASFTSSVLRRPPAGTTFTLTVTNLSKSGYTYDAASDVKKSAAATV